MDQFARLPTSASCVLPLAAHGLGVSRGGRVLLDSIDFTLPASPGITVLLGPNGAGKSLLLRVLTGLVAPDAGHVSWAGAAPSRARITRIGFVFQRPVLLRRSVRDNVAFALKATGQARGNCEQAVAQALRWAGLEALGAQPARALSGGEQQRLALARALATNPDVLILDEPASNLDPASVAQIETVLSSARASGMPVLLVTHDIAQARRLAERVVFMHKGRIVETAAAEAFFSAARSVEAQTYLRGALLV